MVNENMTDTTIEIPKNSRDEIRGLSAETNDRFEQMDTGAWNGWQQNSLGLSATGSR